MAVAPALVTTQWARVLIDGFASAGVTEAIVSPGSRNTPLVAAAAADDRITCRCVIDERSAAFVALGIVRCGHRSALLICTSGTAGAHYLPALLEAQYAGASLIVLTADRPPELQRSGANQTIDQATLFGGIPTWNVGTPEASERALRALRRTAGQAAFASSRPRPRPVHLDVPLRKPLEPVRPTTDEERAFVARVDALLATPPTRLLGTTTTASPEAIEAVRRLAQGAERGIIVAGPAGWIRGMDRALVRNLARCTGFPVYAEATSQLRTVDLAPVACLRAADAVAYAPDVAIQIGEAPVAAEWLRYVEENDVRRAIFTDLAHAEGGWSDPSGDAVEIVLADVSEALLELVVALPSVERPRPALPAPPTSAAFDERAAASAVVRGLPERAVLVLGNSLAVRVVDESGALLPEDSAVSSQRGVSGIDGLVAGAVGTALARSGPTVLLIGDVSLAHDLGSLQLRPLLGDSPLTIVVLDNRGGRIFDRLPVMDSTVAIKDLVEFWRTEPGVDFDAVAAAHGWAVQAVDSADALTEALRSMGPRPGGGLIRAVVA